METQLFQNKYRIKSTRLKHWDYSSCGAYYVTICTKDRKYYFGEIIHRKMILSTMGKIVEQFWMEIPKHYPNIKLDEYVIMPDHIHGIIMIENAMPNVETPQWGVSTGNDMNNRMTNKKRNPHHRPEWKSNSLGSIICQFKSIATKQIRETGFYDFAWQSRFHEHIIRDEIEFNQKRKYIINNPLKWVLNKKMDFDNHTTTI